MIVVIDQFRPDYVERFDMANVRALMDGGVNFERAILGHMAAETVITHNVLTSGLLPKHMGWVNEVYRDVDGVLGPAGSYQVTSSLGCGQFDTLLKAQGYPKLDDQLGGQFISVGQKTTAACSAGHPADPEDIVVHIGSRNTQCDGLAAAHLATARAASTSRPTSTRTAAATSSTPPTPWTTARPRPRPPGCTRSTATASPSATTRRISAATSGPPTRRSR